MIAYSAITKLTTSLKRDKSNECLEGKWKLEAYLSMWKLSATSAREPTA